MADLGIKDVSSTSFGYIIAFLLPGMMLLFGLGLWYPNLFPTLGLTKLDASIGGSALFLLASLSAGLIITAPRWFIYEKLLCHKTKFDAGHFTGLSQSDKMAAFKAVVDEHYRYHQFYGGASIALVPILLFLVHTGYCHSRMLFWSAIISSVALETLLVYTSTDCWKKYVIRGNTIVSGSEGNERHG